MKLIIFGTAELQLTPLFVLVNTVKFQLTDTLENIRYLFEINAAIMA
jgi:hypothetical protein